MDSDPQDDLLNLMRETYAQPELLCEDVVASVGCPYEGLSPTFHNPTGNSAERFRQNANYDPNYPEVAFQGKPDYIKEFMLEAAGLKISASYSDRLAAINVSDVPDKFLCPISLSVMNRPCVASDQTTYDFSVLQQAGMVSPFSREPVIFVCQNLKLRSELETFVSRKEQEHQMSLQPSSSPGVGSYKIRYS